MTGLTSPTLSIQKYNYENWIEVERVELKRVLNKGSWYWKSYRIGRHPDCEVSIDWNGKLISRFQCFLDRELADDDYFVSDGLPGSSCSTSGTVLNSYKILRRTKLKHGDTIFLSPITRLIYFNEKIGSIELFDQTLTGEPDDSEPF